MLVHFLQLFQDFFQNLVIYTRNREDVSKRLWEGLERLNERKRDVGLGRHRIARVGRMLGAETAWANMITDAARITATTTHRISPSEPGRGRSPFHLSQLEAQCFCSSPQNN